MTFGDRLKHFRELKGLTQEQLATQIGVAKTTITGYEKGNREPDVAKIKRLAAALCVSGNELLGIEQKESPAPAEADTGDKDILGIFNYLNEGLISLGLIDDCTDITEQQADILISISRILRAAFEKKQ